MYTSLKTAQVEQMKPVCILNPRGSPSSKVFEKVIFGSWLADTAGKLETGSRNKGILSIRYAKREIESTLAFPKSEKLTAQRACNSKTPGGQHARLRG